ncbi:GlxA family transcriptional regulator [Caulobacter sp. 17J80-11]|uniref:GlxA family transcriptional regulator n=1 Tax=Caulobacter sp. 17J80-11 TaxID=2763502 RepID=UPI001653B0FE|nr:helix-turn-helix domain-containing protein [Caulobacter sp. 17J80-11]MBC6981567.1 DJ-1/PfpI family protein [Caulobacter sp. 17J80-11]
MDQTRHVAMLVYPDAQLLDVAGPLEVFARTARWLAEHGGAAVPAYIVELVGAAPGPVAMSSGLEMMVRRRYAELGPVDTLLVTGGIGYATAAGDPEMLAWLRERAGATRRIGSICSGALVLAAAGLLDGREATTHWAYCDRLAALAPDCRVDPDAIFVRSGRFYTSAGVTTGMDLALALVEEDWGKAVALAVAQELVVYRKRPGGQGQFSRFLEAERRNDRFGELQLWVLDRLHQDLSVERMAEVVGMSPRHFSRQFRAQVGRTPAAWLADLRLEEARRRIESGGFQLKDVARQCGFADEQNLRRVFQRRLGVAPSAYRERFGG